TGRLSAVNQERLPGNTLILAGGRHVVLPSGPAQVLAGGGPGRRRAPSRRTGRIGRRRRGNRVRRPPWASPGSCRPGGPPGPPGPVPVKPDVMPYVYGMNVPPEVVYIIRHAEKPLKPPSSGVDFEGGHNEHSLLPRGWQRSGALAVLFHP